MDIQILKDQIDALTNKGRKLRDIESVFLKLKGLDEEIAKAQKEKSDIEVKLQPLKNKIQALHNQKKEAVSKTVKAMGNTMNEVLPEGKAVINLEDGLFIGWLNGEKTRSYDGLSGGEKTIFDSSLAHALKANFLIVEAAELDTANLEESLNKLYEIPSQVIVNTCHKPQIIPDGFDVINL